MKIRRIRVTSYRGIESLDQEIAPNGAIVQGGNGKGKTSVLRAIRAALSAQDVDADAIRIGSERSEILVDLDDLSIRRAISKAGNTLTVTNSEGFKMTEPQTRLRQLLGTAPLDPLDLYLAKPDQRRKTILEAMPITVTLEQLCEWAPDLPADFSTAGHGLEVIGRAHALYYERRAAANKTANERKAAVTLTAGNVAAQKVAATDPGVTVAQAEQALQATTDAYTALKSRQEHAARSTVQAEGARVKIADLRAQAADLEAIPNATADPQPMRDGVAARKAEIQDIEAQIAALESRAVVMRSDLYRVETALRNAEEQIAETARRTAQIAALRQQADDQENTIKAMAVAAPTDEEMQAAMEAGRAARTALQQATAAAAAQAAADALSVLRSEAQEAADQAAILDKIVKALAKDAPAAALASAEAIPGLTLDGSDVYLDGVRIEARSGAEQMRFAVEIAKRLNAKSKILVVDGLERLDLDQREEFVRQATADDWQLLATLVDRGEAVFAAIEAEPAGVAVS